MSTNQYTDSVMKTGQLLLDRGFALLPIHGINEHGCLCGNPECSSPGKHPRLRNGVRGASKDIRDLTAWTVESPSMNLAFATGAASGVFVVDIDLKSNGPMELAKLVGEHGELPPTVVVETGGGGVHYLFRHPGANVPNRVGLRPGIDIRGDGGYVVTVPSSHISGNVYRWAEGRSPDDVEIAQAPAWLLELIQQGSPRTDGAVVQQASITRVEASAMEAALLLDAAGRYLDKVDHVGEGERNAAAFNLAGHLASFTIRETNAQLSEVQILQLVSQWNAHNAPPLDDAELAQAVHSAMTNGDPRETKWVDPPEVIKKGPESQATSMVNLVIDCGAELLYDPASGGRAYVRIPRDEHHEVLALESKVAKQYLRHEYWKQHRKNVSDQSVGEALSTLAAIAQFESEQAAVSLRVGGEPGSVYIDLGGPEWDAMKVTAEGWDVIPEHPVPFRRSSTMGALPNPQRNGSVDRLFEVLNVTNRHSQILLKAWIVAALMDRGPYPLLVVSGPQGAAKTTGCRLIRALVDPSGCEPRSFPRSELHLMIQVQGERCPIFDNVSTITDDQSDALCRLSTGGSLGTRTLYTTGDETVLDAQCPVIMNGISDFVRRPDLISRSVFLALSKIPASKTLDDADVWARFREIHAEVFGGILDALSEGMRNIDDVKLPLLPRMAGFVRRAVAVAPALGYTPEEFLVAYQANIEMGDMMAIEEEPVGPGLFEFLDLIRLQRLQWEGTASELLAEVERHSTPAEMRRRRYPKTPQHLAEIVGRLQATLARLGFDVVKDRTPSRDRTRLIRIIPQLPEAGESEGQAAA